MTERPSRIHPVTRSGAGTATPHAKDHVVSGTGNATTWEAFSDASGRFHVGHVADEVGIRTVTCAATEFCMILEGRIRLDGPDGTISFGPGEAFVVEAGFLGTWETLEPATRIYARLDPDRAATAP
ncbi:MAG TPA: cupin domain-containing protein [Paracoccaceae bacterium]|nr:cupin domain-containing protein [Paracoccaceae bacterium]